MEVRPGLSRYRFKREKQDMTDKIFVIGAGASGLMAADCLVKTGHQVSVIEARNRIGGRINTVQKKFSRPIETGAEFMHGKQPLTESLIDASGARTTLLSGNRYQLWNGKLKQTDFFDEEWDLFTKALGGLHSDTDIASFLNRYFGEEKYSNLRQKVKGFVEGYDAADLHHVSALALKEEWEQSDDAHHYQIAGGYTKLMEYLEKKVTAGGATVQLSSPVTEIHWEAGKVKIITGGGNILQGGKAIITVPLGVLQKHQLQFSPPLPEYDRLFKQMGFGGVIKIFFEFTHALWEETIRHPLTNAAFIFSDAEIPTWWSKFPDKTPLLTGWLGGPSTFQLPDVADAVFEKALASLAYIFSYPATEISKCIREWHVANWASEPFTFGAYAYPTKGNAHRKKFLSTPVKDTLYFAGEAIYEGTAIGTVEAALVSGQKVAEKIIRR
jgi:monoamine oxidase